MAVIYTAASDFWKKILLLGVVFRNDFTFGGCLAVSALADKICMDQCSRCTYLDGHSDDSDINYKILFTYAVETDGFFTRT